MAGDRHTARVHCFQQAHAEYLAVVAVEEDIAGMVVCVHLRIGQLRDMPPPPGKPGGVHCAVQLVSQTALADDHGLPVCRQRRQHGGDVERALVGVEPPDKKNVFCVFRKPQLRAQRGRAGP